MANPNIVSFLDPSISMDQAALDRQMALAQALQQQAMSPLHANESLKQIPKISPWEGFAKLGQALIANKMNQENDMTRSQLGQKTIQALMRGLGNDQSTQGPSAQGDYGPGEAPNMSAGQTQGAPSGQPMSGSPFSVGNLIRGSAIGQLGGDQASSAYWDQAKMPEIVKQVRAAGIDPNSPQGQAFAKAVATKAGYISPENVREGSTLVNPQTGMPTFNAPKDGRQVVYDAQGNPRVQQVPGGLEAMTAGAAAEQAGKNQQTPDREYRDPNTGAPMARTVAQTVNAATGQIPQGVNPASWGYANAGIPHTIEIAPDGSQKITVLGGPGTSQAMRDAAKSPPSQAAGLATGPSLSDEARLRAQGGNLAEDEKGINANASTAVNKIAQNNKMIELLPQITTGPLNKQVTLVKNLVTSAGGNIGDPAPNQEFEKYAIQGALSTAKQIYGSRVTNQDVTTQIASNPGATMTEKAIYQMLKYDNLLQQRHMDKRNAYYNEYQGPKNQFENWFDTQYPAMGVTAPQAGQSAAQTAPTSPYTGKTLKFNPATGKIE